MWVDLESDNLPTAHDGVIDFTEVNVLEFAMIITDRALNRQRWGYSEVVKMNPSIANNLRTNQVVREMHQKSGLIADSIEATHTLEEIDQEVSEILEETGVEKGQIAIAGSGIAMFDFPLIRSRMPLTASWLAYYPYDTGVFRRLLMSYAGRAVTNPHAASYGPDKAHRALNDIEAHLREAQSFRDWVRALPSK